LHILPALKGHDREGYIDGSCKSLMNFIPNNVDEENSADVILNPAYITWRKQDQLLLRWILSSPTETVLAQVVGCATAKD
ncbi:hypothetical protein HAX54_047534, partial [Datura stramonium]|nr:hypothetical protein [Datura stramonium]